MGFRLAGRPSYRGTAALGLCPSPGRRLGTVDSALDIDTGGGEVINDAPTLPATTVVTESWPPNAAHARKILGPRGVQIVQPTEGGEALPFDDASFDLVSARHPVRPNWPEIKRVLRPGGHYFAQHVGPFSAIELIEFLLGPLSPQGRSVRDPTRRPTVRA